ncbi:MAG: ABC-transporter, ATPase and permease component [Dehalococcoides mccartyi]|uniref:ABC transporter ATP-binding protein n=1 Tax=Dehalococcoides mccartyi TaxID=61435 RepID=UPI0008054C43|nr:ABC transporter ATP-binding protein [Dehalococcoides mccartyi]AQU03689.1 ABC transporter [Dehalococcoides mccartyi]AQU04989.1 ABC transporter [Dehalococcoides mccartyi]MCF7635241.1 ABC-transporter, ATPase and permease component [Dehalococcoides mccartyi]MDN4186388.1 ABC transporter ATP-binding protein [Dehalococcoides mccartyi]MEA2121580.1 putative multidrug export ATP-binding/permease protein [Dehalococcoides mccartyi]
MIHSYYSRINGNSPDEKPKITRGLLKRVWSYARPYRWLVLWMLVLTLATTGLGLLTPLILRDLIDITLPDKNISRLSWLIAALLTIPLLTSFLNVVLRRYNSRVGEGVISDLRLAMFSHLQRMSLSFFTHTKSGELMSRLNNDVIGAQTAISNTFVSIVTSLIQAIVVFSVMITLEWRLALISVAILPLFFWAAQHLGNRLRDIARNQLDQNARMNAVAQELLNISGALLVKLFGRSAEEDRRFKERSDEVKNIGIKRAVTGSLFFASIGLLSAIGIALVYGVGGYFVIQETLTIGTIVALGALLTTLYGALQTLTNAPVDFATSMVSFERVFEVLDVPLDIKEKENACILGNVSGVLEFRNVVFHYEREEKGLLREVRRFGQMQDVVSVLSGADGTPKNGGEKNADSAGRANSEVLENISFRAEPGQLVALVGPSGAGKTTLTYLIPRLYDPVAGQILIDGHDLRDVTLDSLAAQIGMVTQETYLFHDTVRTNLLYGRPDATQAEVEAAAKAANIHKFIKSLPQGYETIVGERGYRLSGGEKQRLALARVILKNPRILVLDEATSSLDSQSEYLIQEALKHVMVGRTSIVIAHRLSTILAADMILVMDHGHIVERGTHRELLALGGLYANLYETQFRSKANTPSAAE